MRLGFLELVVILAIVVIAAGPTQLPKLKKMWDERKAEKDREQEKTHDETAVH